MPPFSTPSYATIGDEWQQKLEGRMSPDVANEWIDS
jgi:hypothetical protein